ncbi:Uncharacterised protein [Bacteroides xylanisolvens]|nr:Uncharacterised protein [Bacteroides xylanisolvens]
MSILYKCSVIQFNLAVRCSNLSIPFICLIVRSIYSNHACLKRPAFDFCGRTIHSELLDCELTIIKICRPIFPNIHCIGRHRTRLADLQFGTIYMAIVRITRHIDGICFNRRFPIYSERGGLIQLIDRIAILFLYLRGIRIRSPGSDNDFSALLNTGSCLRIFIRSTQIPRQIQNRAIRDRH